MAENHDNGDNYGGNDPNRRGDSGSGGGPNRPNGNKSPKKRQTLIIIIVAAIITLVGSTIMSSLLENATTKEITYNEFLEKIEKDEIEKVTFTSGSKIIITPIDSGDGYFKFTYWTTELFDLELLSKLDEKGIEYKGEITDSQSSIVTFLLEWILPFAFIYFIMAMLFRKVGKGGGMMGGVGRSNAKVYVEKETGITFKDVAGQEEAKESLKEIVDFLHNPGKYSSIGAKLPKGALLVGPPGTGKTLLAKAVAGEAKVPFFSLSGSDFVEMYVGVGASRVRDLFKQAQQSAPCIIFIDEIDAIGKSRDTKYGGNDEREQTLNQLLSEMDGFDTSKGLLILAATNRPEVLDKALLRPGRFDRRIIVDRPDLKGRKDILIVHSRNVLMDESVDFHKIALATSGAVGSDLANIINEAAINAVKHGRRAISQSDLFESVEVIFAGKEKKEKILSLKEKNIVAYHEVGHALVAVLEKKSVPVQKITIVPRTMGALGYVMHVPEEEKYLESKDEMIARIVGLFGGRAAEEIVFDSVTSGAANDMEKATSIAKNMIARFGMSDKFGLMSLAKVENEYLDGSASLDCSQKTAAELDAEIRELLKVCYDRAKELLLANRNSLDKITEYLFQKETISGKEFMSIFKKLNPDFVEVKNDLAEELDDAVNLAKLPNEESFDDLNKKEDKTDTL